MDIVYISDLKVDTVIGIFDWERRIRQTVSLDLEMATDRQSGLGFVGFGRVADVVREEFEVAWLKLRLSKPGALRGSRDVGVIIERGERT